MKKITQQEWEKRYEEIENASKICRTMKEVEEKTGYGADTIRRTLIMFPDKKDIIHKNLKEDKEKDGYERKLIIEESKNCKNLKELEKNTGLSYFIIKKRLSNFPIEQQEVKNKIIKNKIKNNTTQKDSNEKKIVDDNNQKVIMIDTSTCSVEDIFYYMEDYVRNGYVLGITDIVLDELDNLQKGKSKEACTMLYIILYNISFFKFYEEKTIEEQDTPDEKILKACKENGTELITSDKMMCIKALLKGIKARYINNNPTEKMENLLFNLEIEDPKKIRKNRRAFVPNANFKNNYLIYSKKSENKEYVKVFTRNGQEKYGSEIAIETGDHIFLAKDKGDYITFIDYEICNKSSKYCAYIRTNYKSYKCDVVINISDERYKKFLEEARAKFNY